MGTADQSLQTPGEPRLDAVLDEIWQRLRAGVADRDHPFHTGVLATVGRRGAEARYVVLRAAERDAGVLRFHTDRRSAKLAEIAAHPGVSLVFVGDGVQVRARGSAIVHRSDALADAAWAASSPMSRRCYLTGAAPGTLLAAPGSALPEPLAGRRPTLEETEPGRAHFCVVRVVVDELDWLDLTADGHRRARYRRGDRCWDGAWIVP